MTSNIFKFDLGAEVVDMLTGFKGRISARTEWLNGCLRYELEALKDGDVVGNWFDEQRLRLAGTDVPAIAPDPEDTIEPEPSLQRTGGGRKSPPAIGR